MLNTDPKPTHASHGLVHPLAEGPLDFIADVHGEIEALLALLRRLVRAMVEAGRAQVILGNHELNILRRDERANNDWFFRPGRASAAETPLDPAERDDFLAFFASLPLAVERDDIRAVHATWDPAMIEAARAASDTMTLYASEAMAILDDLNRRGITDRVARSLAKQNRNPVKLLTSGRETRAAEPFDLDGKMRGEDRHAWWHDYADEPFVVFGHYWRKAVDPAKRPLTERVFGKTPLYELTSRNTISIDYSVGDRAFERRGGKCSGFEGELDALHWPERQLVFDHHDQVLTLDGSRQVHAA